MDQENIFKNVFSNINLPKNLYNIYKDSLVKIIKVNKYTKSMFIELNFSYIIDEKTEDELKKILLNQLPYIKIIIIKFSYKIENFNIENILKEYKDNLLFFIKKNGYLAYSTLKNAEWYISNNNINIQINDNNFILKQLNIDTILTDKIQSSFDKQLNIIFLNNKTKKNNITEKLNKPINQVYKQENIINKVKVDKNTNIDFKTRKKHSSVKIKKEIVGEFFNLSDNIKQDTEILINGLIFDIEIRNLKNDKLLYIFDVTDGNDSITVKFFIKQKDCNENINSLFKKNSLISLKGNVQYDEYSKEINIIANEVAKGIDISNKRNDDAIEKRVELRLHTQMSSMNGVSNINSYIKQAKKFGHTCMAVTDNGVVQSFPDAKGNENLKIIYGLDAYVVDDMGAVVKSPKNNSIDDVFVVFDIETTGLSKELNNITEIGAVKLINNEIVEEYHFLINPNEPIPEKITKLTGIDDEMVKDCPTIEEVLPSFLKFIENTILVAHNASFDVGFIQSASKKINAKIFNSILDTVELSKTLFKDLKNYKLNTIANYLEISLENHHRAVDDAIATAKIFIKCLDILRENNIYKLEDINVFASRNIDKKKLRYYQNTLLVKNYVGLENLYKLVSISHIQYYNKVPIIPKSELIQLREGILIGTAGSSSDFYNALVDDTSEELVDELAQFYDYFEIEPIDNNLHLIEKGRVASKDKLIEINKKIINLGEKYKKLVVATGNVYFLEPEDRIYRDIIMNGLIFKEKNINSPLYFKTTSEMLKDFNYISDDKAYEVVVKNTNIIANLIDVILPIPKETFPPKIEGAEEELKKITIAKSMDIYGNDLPFIVKNRLDKELDSIIKNGFAVMYIISQKLVHKSEEDGYLVGSRGSVGSSFVATMAGITEVNPLPPHYICKKCKYSDFDSEIVKSFAGGSGCDMPDKKCPNCNTELNKDGHEIPFETFLGFDGDKEPDIDLNFSGEYQLKAHEYTEKLFGKDNVFKAGTISTLADKTAYGYVIKYIEDKNIKVRNAEINRLKKGCTGIKKTTGQHPGGLMIVPNGHSIYKFTPIQRPANDIKSSVITTHFDYHSISGKLLKLDLLGHDVPTIIKIIYDITGIDPKTIDLGNREVLSLFTSPSALGLTTKELKCNTGTYGLPEFGTSFVRQMLIDTQPSTFAELVRISGLSHGTDVWFNNAQNLIKDGIATLKDVIPTRDDIMVYLINKGMEKKTAFNIMERVRKGQGLTEEDENIMVSLSIEDWYIESCKRIKYMFPKGHAVAYVMMTVRIGYFKIYYPLSFYAACFSVKFDDFDYDLMCKGIEKVVSYINEMKSKGQGLSAKEKNTMTILELVYEMYLRKLEFSELDIYVSHINKFLVINNKLVPPLCSLQGLGESVAQNIIVQREKGDFLTIEDFQQRTKANKTVIELLKINNIFGNLSETDQMTLF